MSELVRIVRLGGWMELVEGTTEFLPATPTMEQPGARLQVGAEGGEAVGHLLDDEVEPRSWKRSLPNCANALPQRAADAFTGAGELTSMAASAFEEQPETER